LQLEIQRLIFLRQYSSESRSSDYVLYVATEEKDNKGRKTGKNHSPKGK
jgi:hypothetical protein